MWIGQGEVIKNITILTNPVSTHGEIVGASHYKGAGKYNFDKDRLSIRFKDLDGITHSFYEETISSSNTTRKRGELIEVTFYKHNPIVATTKNVYLWFAIGSLMLVGGAVLLLGLWRWACIALNKYRKIKKVKN